MPPSKEPKPKPTPPAANATAEEKKAYTKAIKAWERREDRAYDKAHPEEARKMKEEYEASAEGQREKAKKELKELKKKLQLEAHLAEQARRKAKEDESREWMERAMMHEEDRNVSLRRKHDGERWVEKVIDGAVM